ncbi:hypothetical protein ACFL6G_09435, partial [candidate division KSB1 bacterium]
VEGNLPIILKNDFRVFEKYAEHKSVSSVPNNLIWLSNMKTPLDFFKADSVAMQYKEINKLIIQNDNINVRRIHIFYDDFNNSDHPIDQKMSEALFTSMLLELLHGIQSKVVIIKNKTDFLEEIIPGKRNSGYKMGDIFLLDGALYYSQNSTHGINSKWNEEFNFLPGKAVALYSNFSADSKKDIDYTKKSEQEIKDYFKLREKIHENDRIFELDDPSVYVILKQNYQKIWNYDKYLESLIMNYSNDEQIVNKVINYSLNLQVLDFFEFCNYSNHVALLNDPEFTRIKKLDVSTLKKGFLYSIIKEKFIDVDSKYKNINYFIEDLKNAVGKISMDKEEHKALKPLHKEPLDLSIIEKALEQIPKTFEDDISKEIIRSIKEDGFIKMPDYSDIDNCRGFLKEIEKYFVSKKVYDEILH